ncbi:MAG: caspase family protein [Haliscomenobacter sp.]|nr:caspase family protein [Haliscomenobacter sp.]
MQNLTLTLVLLLAFKLALNAQCISGNCLQGTGVMLYPSGARYVGEFRNGTRDGWGVCYFSDGSNYQGNWSNDRPDGPGVKILPDGSIKKGYWRRGSLDREDPGLLLQLDGRPGNLKSGCISGNCVSGKGIFIFPNGDIYVGDFSGGKRAGVGVCYYANQSEYKGRWVSDLPDGQGTMKYPDGRSRTGLWKYGQPAETQDQGIADANSGPVPPVSAAIQPRCLNGNCQDGYGEYLFQDSSRYSGAFKNGLPEGIGVIFYKTGERYEGMVKSGQLHGKGTIYYIDGRRISGYWEEGIYKQSLLPESVKPISPAVASASDAPALKVWAVIVGIASYSHLQVLRYTDDDAYRIYAFMKAPEGGAVPDEQIRLLIDEAATRNNILRAMQEVFLKAGPNDLVLMYFSGHGLPGTFLPIDYNGLQNKLLHDEINQVLRKSPAKYKLFIADACHSGSMIAMKDPSSQPLLKSYYSSLAQAQPGTALIMSSKSEETSLEASGLRQGVFSYFLIRGLKGEADSNRDNTVNIQELFDFVYYNVRQYTGNLQSPVIQGDYDRKMTVAVYR